MFNDQIISSTLIRKLLKEGNILLANRLLGTNFMLAGTVIRGAQLGRTIGFPTANIKYTPEIVQIPFGVYSARVNNRPAVLNWGMKPTVHNTKEPIVEVHIINFDGDCTVKILKSRLHQKYVTKKNSAVWKS